MHFYFGTGSFILCVVFALAFLRYRAPARYRSLAPQQMAPIITSYRVQNDAGKHVTRFAEVLPADEVNSRLN